MARRPVLHAFARPAAGRTGAGLHPPQPGLCLCPPAQRAADRCGHGGRRWLVSYGATTGARPCTCTWARDPAHDHYFGADIKRWLTERRVASVPPPSRACPAVAATCRTRCADDAAAPARAAGRWRHGARAAAAHGQRRDRYPDTIAATLGLSVRELKATGRYAEDLF